MNPSFHWRQLTGLFCAAAASFVLSARPASAQHNDILLQIDGGRLATGTADFENSEWTLGQRIWGGPIDASLFGTLATDDPGFNARVEDRPDGSDPLPGEAELYWDFLPMFVEGVRSNLFYWNGMDADMNGLTIADVEFQVQPGYEFNLFGQNGAVSQTIFANGSQNRVPGDVVWTTEEDGFLHTHREFRLFDDDENAGTSPDDGIYLISLNLAIEDFLPAEPIFLVFRTPGASAAALTTATTWVTERLDDLVIEGDYNSDGAVNAADYVAWRDLLSSASDLAADGDGNLIVAQGDYAVWSDNYGRAIEIPAGAAAGGLHDVHSVPEPASLVLMLFAVIVMVLRLSKDCRGRGVRTLIAVLPQQIPDRPRISAGTVFRHSLRD